MKVLFESPKALFIEICCNIIYTISQNVRQTHSWAFMSNLYYWFMWQIKGTINASTIFSIYWIQYHSSCLVQNKQTPFACSRTLHEQFASEWRNKLHSLQWILEYLRIREHFKWMQRAHFLHWPETVLSMFVSMFVSISLNIFVS
jgi:hypothetical protein